ncbi:MAG: methyltransferase, partial [Acidimicrobiia bacterium]
ADVLAQGPATSEQLAVATGSHEPSLARLLRVLMAHGVVTRAPGGQYRLTSEGASLRSGGAGLGDGLALLSQMFLRALPETAQSVRSGETAFTRLFGVPFYEHLAQHPEQEASFGRTMGVIRSIAGRISDVYDFSGMGRLVDVGGGHGWRTIEALQANPTLYGVVFDRPGVVEHAAPALAAAGLAGRSEVVGGSFFDEVPGGGDCYLLSGVVFNWDDARALDILGNVASAMPRHARVVLFEPMLPEGGGAHIAHTLDLLMLVLLGGQARSAAQYVALFDQAGLRLERILATPSPFSVIEAVGA